eukprot:403366581
MCKKITCILPSRSKWLRFLKIFLVVNLVWLCVGLVIVEIQIGYTTLQKHSLCDTFLFLMIRSGGQLVNLIFFILGILITRKILSFHGQTTYEKQELRKSYIQALKSLWIVILTFLITCIYLLAYDILEYLVPNCDIVIGNPLENDIFWFFSRSISQYLWMIPLVYLFWPTLKSSKANNLENTQSSSDLGGFSSSQNTLLINRMKNTYSDNSLQQRSLNKINHTQNSRLRDAEIKSSIISSLDEELSDDDEIYQTSTGQFHLTTQQSSKKIIIINNQKPNNNSLVYNPMATQNPHASTSNLPYMHQSNKIYVENKRSSQQQQRQKGMGGMILGFGMNNQNHNNQGFRGTNVISTTSHQSINMDDHGDNDTDVFNQNLTTKNSLV